MKKAIALLLCALMVCSLCGCVISVPESVPYEGGEITLTTRATLRLGESEQEMGLRFLTTVSAAAVKHLRSQGTVRFGTLVAPVDIMTAANATHAALRAAKKPFLDIPTDDAYAVDGDDFVFAGSVDRMLRENYGRKYAGVGYLSLTKADGTVTYYYADWTAGEEYSNRKSVYELAAAAYCDRTAMPDETHIVDVDGAYSPYTAAQLAWLGNCLYSGINIHISVDAQCTASPLPESEWYRAPYDIAVTNNSGDYVIVLTVKEGADYNFATHCAAFMNDGALKTRITDSRITKNPIARAHKYYISPDGLTLTYYHSDFSPSY